MVDSVRTATDILNRRDTLGGRGMGEHHLAVGVANAPQVGHHSTARLVEHLHLFVHLTNVYRNRGLKSQLSSHCIQYGLLHLECLHSKCNRYLQSPISFLISRECGKRDIDHRLRFEIQEMTLQIHEAAFWVASCLYENAFMRRSMTLSTKTATPP